ncbi:hypothetical protein FISHEDRAFT_73189 [Fistulina hepatica ATCC 64428]|uniref:Uncharacterized protein n=1 Tax=Fistulina hepatica ATCC 64428 TaxID=1128425 RepID=A0A0D7AER8_9AGAR|nr:hypothetical protein FISHEDRAFT_73189 [Fistulina hepatica ATCC 64428]
MDSFASLDLLPASASLFATRASSSPASSLSPLSATSSSFIMASFATASSDETPDLCIPLDFEHLSDASYGWYVLLCSRIGHIFMDSSRGPPRRSDIF